MTGRLVHVTRTRTIQVFGSYSAETHTVHDETTLAPEEDPSAWRTAARKQLDAELDAWEKDMHAAARGRLEAEATAAAKAKAGPPLLDTTRKELRTAAAELAKLTGEPVNVEPPLGEADGQKLLKQLRAGIFDTKKAKGIPTT